MYASTHRLTIDRVPVLPETQQLCRHFGIDPVGLIGFGALLATITPARAAVIGRVERGRASATPPARIALIPLREVENAREQAPPLLVRVIPACALLAACEPRGINAHGVDGTSYNTADEVTAFLDALRNVHRVLA